MPEFVTKLEADLRARLGVLEARRDELERERVVVDREIEQMTDAIRPLAGNKAVRPTRAVLPPPVEQRAVTLREVRYVVERLAEPFTHGQVAEALHVELTDRVRGFVLDLEHEGVLVREGERRGLKFRRA